MRILLTNDDGIHEAGLAALRAAALEFGDVTVVAPAHHQSAASHAITLGDIPVRRVRIDRPDAFEGLAVDGKPADCVRLAILTILPKPPELVISGINLGANVGVHVFYSGTVAAAAEAAMLNVPGIAFSMAVRDQPPDFRRAIDLCRGILRGLLDRGLAAGDLLNVNIPLRTKPKGIRVVRQGRARLNDRYEPHGDGDNQVYRVCAGDYSKDKRDTDIAMLGRGYVTVTPLHVDMTDHAQLGDLSPHNWDDMLPKP